MDIKFDLKKSAIYKALLIGKIPVFGNAGALKVFFFVLSILSLLGFALQKTLNTSSYFLEISFFFFCLFLIFLQLELFFKYSVTRPKLLISKKNALSHLDEVNLAEFLNFESACIMEAVERKGGADSYLLLYYLLKKARDMDFVFHRALISKKNVLRDLKFIFDEREMINNKEKSPCFTKTMKEALVVAARRKNERITPGDLFVALSKHNNYLRDTIYYNGMTEDDMYDLTSWRKRLRKKESPLLYKNLIKLGSIGKEWNFGYTPLLDNFSIDWTEKMKLSGFPETVGHRKEIKSLERVMSREEINSVVLVGDSGAGRRSIIQEIARRSFLGEGLQGTNYLRILELDLSSVLARTEGLEETEKILDKMFGEAVKAGNVILVINDLHKFIAGEQRPGVINISGILEPYLHIPSFRLIGVTDFAGFRKNIEKNSTLFSLMEKVEMKKISHEEALILLEKLALSLENKYHKLISFGSIKKAIEFSDKYMQNEAFPEKAFTLLEEAVVHADQKEEDIVLQDHVAEIISEKTEVPVGRLDEKEKEVLLNLEDLIHKRIVNQENAVRAVSSALRRSRADVGVRKGTIGGFLFLGPTGVGKTEMAKAIADVYFGSEKKINRIDMSEFQNISDVQRIIGSSQEEGVLTSGVREDPFSLILLDEIEKAHPDILNLFLQILDEGHITDGEGRRVDFRNTMVIATSNAGYQIILDAIEQKLGWGKVKAKILKRLFQTSVFRPEFVNRFDDVIIFKPLSRENLIDVAGIQLEEMAKNFIKKDMHFVITEALKEKIMEIGYDPVFGAREMQRAIQDNISNKLASAVLEGYIQEGDRFTVDEEHFEVRKLAP